MPSHLRAKAVATETAAKLAAAKLRVERYASMTQSEEALMAALLPFPAAQPPRDTQRGGRPSARL